MVYAAKKVKEALRHLGFRPMPKGKPTSHKYWLDQYGRKIQLVAHKGYLTENCIYDMTNLMDASGICTRPEFKALLRDL